MTFESNNNLTNLIEIWTEERGRKSNTFISGWEIDDIQLKEHLKIIKKKKGCNGSIKDIIKDTGKVKVMQLQGKLKDYLFAYLIENGVNDDAINIKL